MRLWALDFEGWFGGWLGLGGSVDRELDGLGGTVEFTLGLKE